MPLNPDRPNTRRGRDRRFNRAKIKVGYRCDQDCLFCDCRQRRHLPQGELRDLARKVMLARDRGFHMVVFSGGEPTLHPDFPRLVTLCTKLAMPFGLVSNGHMLDQDDRVLKLVTQGLRFVQLSLHATSPDTHTELTGAPNSDLPWRALSCLVRAGVDLTVNIVLTRQNAPEIPRIVERVAQIANLPDSPRAVCKVTWMNPATLTKRDWERSVLSLEEASQTLTGLFAFLNTHPERAGRLRVVAAGVPLCALPGYEDRSYDMRWENLAEEAELLDAAFQREPLSGQIKPESCAGCRYVSNCPGIWEAYADRIGVQELKPRRGPVSNSFAYEPIEDWPGFDPADCPILKGERTLSEPARSLLIPHGDGVRLYRTDTADFTPEQITGTVHDLGQVYMDISGKLFHEDFSTDLQKLDPHPVCAVCPKRRACATVHCPRKGENVFVEAEKGFDDFGAMMSGRVLDVGGGPIRYGDLLGNLVESGRIEYHVIDPDVHPKLAAFIEQYHLEAGLFVGHVEIYPGTPESFDWILVLRSHNHLYDLDRAYHRMAEWLKPGGRMLLIDNTVYGVVRNADIWEQIQAKGGDVHFEHFNNHTSTEAIPYPLKAGLTLIAERPVAPNSANQWWALFEKPR